MDYSKQQSVREHVVKGVVVVKEPFGSLTEHIESSKSTAGGSGDCKASQQELPLRPKPFLKHPARLELIQHDTKLKQKLQHNS